jgi:hypothetical protein
MTAEKTMAMLERRKGRHAKARRTCAVAIGELVIAHNKCHSQLAMIFAWLVNPIMKLGLALWHTQRTDKAQRVLLAAAAEAKLKRTSAQFKALKWAMKKANALSEFRNDVVHADIGFDVRGRPYGVFVNWFTVHPNRAERLMQEVRLTASLRSASRDLQKLDVYLFHLWAHLIGREPLPKRPRLRFVRAKGLAHAAYDHPLL